jgi:hypothetical protein
MTKIGIFKFFAGFKNEPKNLFLSFSTKIDVKKNRKKIKMVNLIFEKIMTPKL